MIRILQEQELIHAAGLSRFVFDNCLRYRMEFPQTIPYVEDYLKESNLKYMCQEGKLTIWGVFERRYEKMGLEEATVHTDREGRIYREELLGVSAMQSDGMITMLYILPQYQSKRYATELMNTMKQYAKQVYGLERITVNANPAWTYMYFLKHGFSVIGDINDMHRPFISMQAGTNDVFLYQKRNVSGKIIALAIVGSFLFATVAGGIFMIGYLF
ncbi:MAG: GNAT family N-acetyltransferase [Lachnospiraceae bacterium]|nr:GNAT family N-acetyltransferase [Lachnospiraceae bacterium]